MQVCKSGVAPQDAFHPIALSRQ